MGRIFLHGDIHGYYKDIRSLKRRLKIAGATLEDTLILLGDVGANYWLDERDIEIKRALNDLEITVFALHGNHECRPQNISSYKYTYSDRYKCVVYYENAFPNLLFPVDGEVYIEGLRFLFIGGAYSVDKQYRLDNGLNWFEDEQMSEEDKCRVRVVVKNNNKFDYVCSHTCPIKYEPTYLFLPFINQSTVDKTMECYLQEIHDLINKDYLKGWFYGHFHDDKQLDNKFTILFKDTILLEDRKIEKEE